jgi:hypothetical protein
MRWFCPLVLVAAVLLPARAAAPRDELLKLVPDDTAICLVVQGLRDRSKAVAQSPLAEWIGANGKSALAGAPELDKLKDVEKLFASFLGVSLADLRDDIFGDALVLSYQPGAPGKPETDRGFVLLQARDPAKLATLVDKLNTLQKSTGELVSVDTRTHRGVNYSKRSKGDAGGEFYLLADGLFAFAAQEDAIKGVIDRRLDAKAAVGTVAKSIAKLGVERSFLVCWFNPRRLDAEVAAHAAAADTERDRVARRQFSQIWRATDDLALYLDAGTELELGVAAAYRPEAMPLELKAVLAGKPKPSTLWPSIPDNAMFALAGRATGTELLEAALSFAPAEDRTAARQDIEKALGAVIGKDKVPAVLKGVGPDWAFWATAPAAGGWFPGLSMAVKLDAEPTLVDSVLKTVQFYSQWLQVQYNRDHDDAISSATARKGAVDVTTFTNAKLFPPGLRPSFGVAEGHFVLAGTEDLVAGFRAVPPAAENARVPFLRVSADAIRGYIDKHGHDLAAWIGEKQERPAADVAKELQNAAEILKVMDRAEMTAEGDGTLLKLTIRLKFVKPLSK